MKQIMNCLWGAFLVAVSATIGAQLYDRFTGNGEAWSFYAHEIDMTCVVAKDEGQKAMYCVRGEENAQQGKAAGDE